ncbi:MAG: hypothetical protein NTY65_15280 [Planctomycetota bacterium]|nr:hypothetical protein [Planctomycetota bacterium]
MSILFRCPCGRSMVVEEDRAGAVVMCPNCRRSLKVPSGKDRGVHIASAPSKVRTSRLCQRCSKEVPVDSQMCPHCKAILLDVHGAPPPAKAAGAAAAPAGGPAVQPILYGGARGSWFTRLSPGGKGGVLGGAAAFVLVLAAVGGLLYSSWYASQVREAQGLVQKAFTDGRKLEAIGKFQEAYDLCWAAVGKEEYLRKSGESKDAQSVDALKARITALQYLVYEPKVRGSVHWKPKSQGEYDQAVADLRKDSSTYKERLSVVADAGIAAAQFGKSNPGDQAGYEQKVIQAMDTYVKSVNQMTEPQRAQFTFQSLMEGMKQLAGANRNWAKPAERDVYLNNAGGYLGAAKETAARGEDNLLPR